MNITMFKKFYSLLYYGVINTYKKVENSYNYCDVGDILITADGETVRKFNAARQDIITSDREAAAFAFWYCYTYQKKALEYISQTAYNNIISEIVKQYNAGMI